MRRVVEELLPLVCVRRPLHPRKLVQDVHATPGNFQMLTRFLQSTRPDPRRVKYLQYSYPHPVLFPQRVAQRTRLRQFRESQVKHKVSMRGQLFIPMDQHRQHPI